MVETHEWDEKLIKVVPCEDTVRMSRLIIRERVFTRIPPFWHLDLDFTTSSHVRNKFLLLISYSV